MEHSEFYRLFTHFWWLLFSLFWMIAGAARLALAAPLLEGLWRQARVPHVADMAMALLLMAATYAGLRYDAARDF